MPSTEGIYRQKGLGFSPHPGLKKNKPSSLGRSASLVLQKADAGYPEYEDQGNYLPPIGGASSSWKAAPLLDEMPARLEGCRQRLIAADRAVSKAASLGLSDARPEVSEIDLLQRDLEEVIRQRAKAEDFGKASSVAASSSAATFDRGEPAPEPPGSAMSGASKEASNPLDLISADQVLEAEAQAEAEDLRAQLSAIEAKLLELDKKWRTAEKERRVGELIRSELTGKLKTSEDLNSSLQGKLEQLQKLQQSGQANSRQLQTDLSKQQADAEALRQNLGVSEGVVKDLRGEVSDLQNRESVLTTQLNTLHARVYAAESESEGLRASLNSVTQSKEDLAERLASEEAARLAAEASHSQAESARSEAEQGRKDAEVEWRQSYTQSERARKEAVELAETLKAAKTAASDEASKQLEERNRSHAEISAKHAELEKTHESEKQSRATAEKNTQDLQAQLEAALSENQALAKLRAAGAEAMRAEPAATEQDAAAKPAASAQTTREKARGQLLQANKEGRLKDAIGGANKDAVMAPLKPRPDVGDNQDSANSKYAPTADLLLRAIVDASKADAGPRPTQCQVDTALEELRLLSLGPVGAPSIIAFADIVSVEKAADDQDKTITIQWVPNKAAASAAAAAAPLTAKLLPSDQEAANMLVAALTVFDRAAPGDLLKTPTSVAATDSELTTQ